LAGLEISRISEGFIAVSELRHFLTLLQRLILLGFFLVSVLLILRETRHTIVEFLGLIRAAWADEWSGKERVAKCNRGVTVISFSIMIVIFLTQQAHTFFGSQHESTSTVIWLFISCMAFAVISLLLLANLEKHKLLHGSRRRTRPRR